MTPAALLLLALTPGVADIQQTQPEAPAVVLPDVEVTATKRGVALGGQEPIVSYDAAQIQAFGATNIGELVTLLEAQTRSARNLEDSLNTDSLLFVPLGYDFRSTGRAPERDLNAS